jgi:BirA family transcriptional regulator, biotin operon repressor / biotin---[acetyl-CoA-carboxylase] ligase
MNKNKTAYRLLQLLSDGRFHSGQILGQTLNITRSAIWKAVKQLEQLGIEVHAVTGKGYRIPNGLELLDEAIILNQLDKKNSVDQLTLLTTTTSTNEFLLKIANQQPQQTIVCLAEHQMAGRGRREKTWFSSFGSSIYLSLLYHFNKDPSEIASLSLVTAIAVLKALNEYGINDGLSLKWPNDILFKGRKLSGILIEMMAKPFDTCSVVIGIGLNVQIPYKYGKTITQPWIDIAQITQKNPERNRLIGMIINQLLNQITLFEKNGFTPFIKEWVAHDRMIGKTVTVSAPQSTVSGVMQGISDKGELLLLTEDNQVRHFLSGEVSLRLRIVRGINPGSNVQ